MPKGYVFTYSDLIIEVNQKEAVIKALNRMVQRGKIEKLAKGKYYKPENTPFGNLKPPQYQIVKDMLEENNKVTGYLTGYSIYNQLGLTTQISNIVQIGKNVVRPDFKRDRFTISVVLQKNTITKENIPLLQILDSIRNIKKIPDTTLEASVTRLSAIIAGLDEKAIHDIIRLSLKYPPSTRALLGAIIETTKGMDADTLYKTLNPITKYKYGQAATRLTNAPKWNIV